MSGAWRACHFSANYSIEFRLPCLIKNQRNGVVRIRNGPGGEGLRSVNTMHDHTKRKKSVSRRVCCH